MRKRIFALLLTFVMAVGLLPATALAEDLLDGYDGYMTDSNRIMAYRQISDSTIDVMGFYNGSWLPTTERAPYYPNGTGYLVDTADLTGANISASAQFVNDGTYVQLSYTVEAGAGSITDGKLAVYAETRIGGNSRATVEIIRDPAGDGVIGLKLVDATAPSSPYFNLYFDGVDGVTPADTYWFGTWGTLWTHRTASRFENLSDQTVENTVYYTKDENGVFTTFSGTYSGVAFSWHHISLQPGESKTYSVLLGVGTMADPPALAPAITTTAIPDGQEGEQYEASFAATGTEPIIWSITAGDLPGGLTLDVGTGKLSGRVDSSNTRGEYSFTVNVANDGAPTAKTSR